MTGGLSNALDAVLFVGVIFLFFAAIAFVADRIAELERRRERDRIRARLRAAIWAQQVEVGDALLPVISEFLGRLEELRLERLTSADPR